PLTFDLCRTDTTSMVDFLPWDPFREILEDNQVYSCDTCFNWSKRILKVTFIGMISLIVLACLVTSKISLFFITSGMNPHFKFRETPSGTNTHKDVNYSSCGVPTCMTFQERPNNNIRWIWALHLSMCVPYMLCMVKSIWKVTFKTKTSPDWGTLAWVLVVESVHSCGLFFLAFLGLPKLDVFRGMLTLCAIGCVPSLLRALTLSKTSKKERILDALSAIVQFAGMLAWMLKQVIDFWPIPVGVILISVVWWENFIDKYHGQFDFSMTWYERIAKRLTNHRRKVQKSQVKISIFVSLWKMVFSTGLLLALYSPSSLPWGTGFNALFDQNNFKAHENTGGIVYDWLYVFAAQSVPGIICKYLFTLAVRGSMQVPCIAVPMLLSTPISLGVSIWACYDCNSAWKLNAEDSLFWNCFSGHDGLVDVLLYRWGVVGVAFWVAEMWTTRYLWFPKVERLAKTGRIFTMPRYCSLMLEQSLALNRRRNDKEFEVVDRKTLPSYSTALDNDPDQNQANMKDVKINVKESRKVVPKIYCCATMWHENEAEMMQIMKSCFWLDKDQHARRMVKDEFGLKDDLDYYEFDIHIWFDDAFELHMVGDKSYSVNKFVKQFCQVIQDAAFAVHRVRIANLDKPEKIVTPYGGQFKYTFPGGNKMYVHLKDKMLIRHKKRWSQVMYMYYLLGENLWARRDLSSKQKQITSENTFILALDGDVDFQPDAVRMLLDLMKRDLNVAATCGRIHPIGSGPMVWYQKFEYAVGHWMSKSTEHVLGCVLCSPGCFSLFRGSALMDDNVMKTYTRRPTEGIHYVQYDQGEDRWLCTLLLQQGFKVEYSAAADALTYCPEGFGEFFNQRRRWTPSTFANILDLLSSAGRTVQNNQNISTLYMIYQASLFVSSILGPSTIFLVIVNSLNIAINIGKTWSFVLVIIPMVLYILICLLAKPDVQIMTSAVLSTLMAVVQIVVLVGIMRQVASDSVCHPNTMLLIFMTGSFVIGGLMHPQEATTLVHGFIYYLAIPTMYLLLIVYSICNMNVVSWGTREEVKTSTEKEEERLIKESNFKSAQSEVMAMLPISIPDNKAGVPINCGSLCRCLCCLKDGRSDEAIELERVHEELSSINQRLEVLLGEDRAKQVVENIVLSHTESEQNEEEEEEADEEGEDSEEEKTEEEESQDADKDFHPLAKGMKWITDKALGRGKIGELDDGEEDFWKELILKYLYPLVKNKIEEERVTDQLKDLRNKCIFAFILLNVLLIALMETVSFSVGTDSSLAIKWNCTDPILKKSVEVELDPVALLFICVFGIIVAIQFICMFGHRLMTWLQIMAITAICPPKKK
ncbi:hypothetical protein CAPTEDRAFT_22207, partial [Capitella teleta]